MSNFSISPFANPFTSFPVVDSFSLMGAVLPGQWRLQKATRHWEWAYVVGPGYIGATYTSVSGPPVNIEFRGEFWNPVDWATFKQIDALILKSPAKGVGLTGSQLSSLALGVTHPELQRLGVNSVVLFEKEPLIQEAGGKWVTHLRFLEWTRALKLAPPPKFAIPDITVVGAINAATDFSTQKDQLNAQIAAQKAKL